MPETTIGVPGGKNLSTIDYEAEYYRQVEIIKALTNENEHLRYTIIGMCKSLFAKVGMEQ